MGKMIFLEGVGWGSTWRPDSLGLSTHPRGKDWSGSNSGRSIDLDFYFKFSFSRKGSWLAARQLCAWCHDPGQLQRCPKHRKHQTYTKSNHLTLWPSDTLFNLLDHCQRWGFGKTEGRGKERPRHHSLASRVQVQFRAIGSRRTWKILTHKDTFRIKIIFTTSTIIGLSERLIGWTQQWGQTDFLAIFELKPCETFNIEMCGSKCWHHLCQRGWLGEQWGRTDLVTIFEL